MTRSQVQVGNAKTFLAVAMQIPAGRIAPFHINPIDWDFEIDDFVGRSTHWRCHEHLPVLAPFGIKTYVVTKDNHAVRND